ncbi:hypothetical protein ECAE60S_04543 [Eoetvoesiella caeni]
MHKQSLYQRFVAGLLIVSMSATSTLAFAQSTTLDPSVAGRQAQSFGYELLQNFQDSGKPTLSGQELTMPGTTGGKLNINDLYPGTSQKNQRVNSFFFPGEYSTSVDDYKSVHDSGQEMDRTGTGAQGTLWDDAQNDNPSLQGAAYKILLDMTNRSRPDMRNDPMFNQTKDTLANLNDLKKEFGDCSTETTFKKNSRPAHVPVYEQCERVVDKSAQCEIIHNYDAAVVKHYNGPFNLDTCGEGCTQLWIGQVGDNYWGGWCAVYEQSTTVTVVNPDAITSAVLEYVEYDDYMQVWVGPVGQEVKVFNGPNENFPPETAGECELSTNWRQNPGIDVTQYFKNVEAGKQVNFKIRVSVADEGEGFGRIRINYDPAKAITKDEWVPQDCVDAAIAVKDGFAKGTAECTDDPSRQPVCEYVQDGSGNSIYQCDHNPEGWTPGTPYDGCQYLNGVKVCENSLKPSPIAGIPNMCRKVKVEANYDFYKGQMGCYTDANGIQQCPDNQGGNLDNCGEFENNSQCGFIGSKCVKGAEGASGECYVFEDTYDCGYDANLGTVEKEVKYECSGPIRCMGTDCLDITMTQNNDFAKANALLNAAQFMAQDMACTGQDENGNPTGEENVVCSVFPGTAGQCKKAVGGVVNCCEKPDGISMMDYVTLLMTVPKIDTAIMSLGDTNSIRSAYVSLKEPITQGWTEISQPFTSSLENVSGVFDKLTQGYDQIVEGLKDSVANLYDKAFGSIADNATTGLGSSAGAGAGAGGASQVGADAAVTAGQEFVKNAGNLIGWVGTIYTIYTVTMLVIKMVYKCTPDELEMNVKRELKSCSYVGSYCKTEILGLCIEKRESYCCFSSPLSRIIQEQGRPQLGLSFGDPENPTCEGLAMEQIGQIDWDRVNLDEWLGILQANGHWPNADNINIESLTGAGTTFDLGERINAQERALERLKDTDIDQARIDVSKTYKPFTGASPTTP